VLTCVAAPVLIEGTPAMNPCPVSPIETTVVVPLALVADTAAQ
jgi:hypothetical protein